MRPQSSRVWSKEFAELAAMDQAVRRRFIGVELLTCRTSLEMGEFELAQGNLALAAHELDFADKIMLAIKRFLPKISEEFRSSLETDLAKLRTRRDRLKERLNRRRPKGSSH
jgi:hypothetical protein